MVAAEFQSTLLLTLFSIFIFIPSIAVTTRRLHDTGRTGWWQLIYIVPLIGLIVMLIFLVQASQEDNQYIYNLSTDTLTPGSWQLKIKLDDNKEYKVLIAIRN